VRIASLDLGSNTTLLMVADVEGGRIEKVVHDETRVTKLGQGVHAQRKFHPDALKRMYECLSDYALTIDDLKCDKVIAVATSAARDVSNGDELLKMGASMGIPIHIISGEREARLTYFGAISDRPSDKNVAVIDVGGGSTEIISAPSGHPRGMSVDVGSVRLTELLVHGHPVSDEDLKAIQEYCAKAFAEVPPAPNVDEVIAVAGTPTTLAALDQKTGFSEELVNGYKLSLHTIEDWIRDLASMTVEQRERLPGMQPKRADVIVTGASILAAGVRHLKKTEVIVSTRGVRYGVALAWQEF
jgi:exopolyphosphatase/guanosine-5'-triphosphate,3'-diphosphate pyrophosphatase